MLKSKAIARHFNFVRAIVFMSLSFFGIIDSLISNSLNFYKKFPTTFFIN